jgi:hypothetical protein
MVEDPGLITTQTSNVNLSFSSHLQDLEQTAVFIHSPNYQFFTSGFNRIVINLVAYIKITQQKNWQEIVN